MKRIISLLTLFVIGCEKNIESDYIGYDCDEVISYYQESVAPILSNHCVGCHSRSSASGGLVLDRFDGAVLGVMDVNVINRINLHASSPSSITRGSEKLSHQPR